MAKGFRSIQLFWVLVLLFFGLNAHSEPRLEEIVVTGSYIQGTAEDAALPVDVISRDDLEDIGNPTLIEMVRNMGVSSGNLGETNQFDTRAAQGNEGVVTVNLRGLGSARTLVLINNRRHVATESLGVDISMIRALRWNVSRCLRTALLRPMVPMPLVGWLISLRETHMRDLRYGALLWTYPIGMETRRKPYLWGQIIRDPLCLCFGVFSKIELKIRDRDWALRPFLENPALWGLVLDRKSLSFFPGVSDGAGGRTLLGAQQPDPNCDLLGGFFFGGFCRFQSTLSLATSLKIKRI